MSKAEDERRPNRVQRRREDLGLTQAALAAEVGMTPPALSRLESGAWWPNTVLALRLARRLGSTVEALFPLEEAELPGGGLEVARAGRLELAEVRGAPQAFALETPEALEPVFRPAAAFSSEAGAITRPNRAFSGGGPTAVLHGCDPAFGVLAGLLEHPRGGGPRLLLRFASSAEALEQLARGRSHLAGIHLVEDGDDAAALGPDLWAALPGGGSLVTFARFEQGLMVAAGNPLGLSGVADLARADLRFRNREEGSGSRALLDRCLARAGLDPAAVPEYGRLCASHFAGARAVAAGDADAALGLRAVAIAYGLDFVPLAAVRCDLAVPADLEDHPAVAAALDLLGGAPLRQQLRSLPGYDAEESGRLVATVAPGEG